MRRIQQRGKIPFLLPILHKNNCILKGQEIDRSGFFFIYFGFCFPFQPKPQDDKLICPRRPTKNRGSRFSSNIKQNEQRFHQRFKMTKLRSINLGHLRNDPVVNYGPFYVARIHCLLLWRNCPLDPVAYLPAHVYVSHALGHLKKHQMPIPRYQSLICCHLDVFILNQTSHRVSFSCSDIFCFVLFCA